MQRGLVVVWALVVAACGNAEKPAAKVRPPVAPDTVVVGTYELTLRPRQGRMELRPVRVARAHYDFAGAPIEWKDCDPPGTSCTPDGGTVGLYTDQAKVTYRSHDGSECFSNGQKIDCSLIANPACNQPNRFCGPISLYSNVTFGQPVGALADVIVQLAQEDNQANAVQGCFDDVDGTFGTCRNVKVDHPNSNLTSPIPGNLPGLVGCSYCYGNKATANALGFPGLEHAVISGNADFLELIDTDTFGLRLTSDEDMTVTITVRAAVPTLAPAGQQLELNDLTAVACAKPGVTTLTVFGGGFGPPLECLAEFPPTECPLSGKAADGYYLTVDTTAGPKILVPSSWSDDLIKATLPAELVSTRVTVHAPHGPPVTSQDLIRVCPEYARGPLLISGASVISDGEKIRATVEIGHGVSRQKTTRGDVTMRLETAVLP